ncbi:Hypothetical predicted protein, partial [Pelobates cultripes]
LPNCMHPHAWRRPDRSVTSRNPRPPFSEFRVPFFPLTTAGITSGSSINRAGVSTGQSQLAAV